MESVTRKYGVPKEIRVDNGPEFVSLGYISGGPAAEWQFLSHPPAMMGELDIKEVCLNTDLSDLDRVWKKKEAAG